MAWKRYNHDTPVFDWLEKLARQGITRVWLKGDVWDRAVDEAWMLAPDWDTPHCGPFVLTTHGLKASKR